jgi:hypothetical protein
MTDTTNAPESAQFIGLPTFSAAVGAELDEGYDRHALTLFKSAGVDKLRLGVEKYGHDAWRNHDMLAEALNELVDLSNYAYLRWRQLHDLPTTALRENLIEAMVALWIAAFEQWQLLTALLRETDAQAEPRSLTGANYVGVQPPEFFEV